MVARTLDDLRRLVARIGTDATVRAVDAAIPTATHRPAMPATPVLSEPPAGRDTTVHAIDAPTVRITGEVARTSTPPARTVPVGGAWERSVQTTQPLGSCAARAATASIATTRVRAAAVATPAQPPPPVRTIEPAIPAHLAAATAGAGAGAVRRMRRTPVAWAHIAPARLRTAWRAILTDHGHPGTDLELVGVYGPLPVDAVASIALTSDRRATIGLADHPGRPTAGDLALARHLPTGRLLRSTGATHAEATPPDGTTATTSPGDGGRSR